MDLHKSVHQCYRQGFQVGVHGPGLQCPHNNRVRQICPHLTGNYMCACNTCVPKAIASLKLTQAGSQLKKLQNVTTKLVISLTLFWSPTSQRR